MSEVNVTITPINETVNVNVTEVVEQVNANVTPINEVVNVTIIEGEQGGGEVDIVRSDLTLIASVTAPDTYPVNDSDVTLVDSQLNPLRVVTVKADSSINEPIADTIIQLKDSLGANIGSPQNFLAESTDEITAPDSTLTVNSSAFGAARSNQTVDILLRDQNNDVITPSSLAYPQININRYDEIDLYMERIGSTNATWRAALRTFKASLLADGTWQRAILINPIMGGTAATHQVSMVGSYLRLLGGITHDANGMVGNGTNGYYLVTTTINALPQNSHSAILYLRNNVQGNVTDLSSLNAAAEGISLNPRNSTDNNFSRSYTSTANSISNNDSRGVIGIVRENSSGYRAVIRSTQTAITQTSLAIISSQEIAGMCNFLNGAPIAGSYSTRQQSFIWMGLGLTSSQMTTLTNAIVALQTSLGRNV